MLNTKNLFKMAIEQDASDLHVCVGSQPTLRICCLLQPCAEDLITAEDMRQLLSDVVPQEKECDVFQKGCDLAIEFEGVRFRTSIYQERRGIAAAFRLILPSRFSAGALGLPAVVKQLAYKKRGLVLVSGAAGSGKTTTLAYLIDRINTERNAHIITIEDPIEYLHENKRSLVNQREVGKHVSSFATALRSSLREDPDVIQVGEMRDLETIATAMTAAETGHLVLSTLHTGSAVQTINRIIDVFPAHQQDQIRTQLADTLEMVVSQVLIPSANGKKRYLACEIMVATSAIRSSIRERKTYQIQSAIETGKAFDMITFDRAVRDLLKNGYVLKKDVQPWLVETKRIS